MLKEKKLEFFKLNEERLMLTMSQTEKKNNLDRQSRQQELKWR
jgi:hypothetical protein